MSIPRFEVWLDEERQIVRQRLHGQPDLTQFLQISAETGQYASQLRCPAEVRILVEGKGIGRLSKPTRSAAMEALKRPDLKKVAVVTSNRFGRIMLRFIVVATGIDKVRAFPDKVEALKWLQS